MVAYHRLASDQIYQVFTNPNVFIFKASYDGKEVIERLSKIVKPGDWCLESLMWFLTWRIARERFGRWKYFESLGVNYVVMANSVSDENRCRFLGIPVQFMPQGQFINERVFPLVPSERIYQYDAFYAAQARSFKRMYLAQSVKSLYILTYLCPTNSLGENDLKGFEPRVAHAQWNKTFVHDIAEIVNLLHQSRCALALSSVEGAMWACLEALLCGIPVVSTPSKGGRSRYLNSINSLIVRPQSASVAKAVERIKSHPFCPQKIRESVLRIIDFDRNITSSYFRSNILCQSKWTSAQIKEHLFNTKKGIGQFLIGQN